MARTASEVTADILNRMPDTYDKSTGSVIYDLQAPVGEEVAGLEGTNDDILKNAFFETADDHYKEVIAKDRADITRRPATYATGYVTITGDPGTDIPVGTQVASDFLIFKTTEAATIPAEGNVMVLVQCETAGSAGNVPQGSIYEFPVTIAGLNTVTNASGFTNGYDIESMDDFETRYYAVIRKSAGAGTEEDYETWALEVDGVAAAVCFGRTPTIGSVTVYIMNQNHRAADATLIQAVSDHLDEKKPCPAEVYVNSVSEVAVDVAATVSVSSGTVADYQEAIEAAIDEYIKEIGYSKDTRRVSLALVANAILSVDGVIDADNITLNGSADSIALGSTEIAYLDEVTLS